MHDIITPMKKAYVIETVKRYEQNGFYELLPMTFER